MPQRAASEPITIRTAKVDTDRLGLFGRNDSRRVKRALYGLLQDSVGKDVVSRAWRKLQVDWGAWCACNLAGEDIVRLILDVTVIKTRPDRKAANI